jgi:hypothetical protein
MGATPIMVIASLSLIPIVPIASLVSIGPTDAPGERDDGDRRTVGRGEKLLAPTAYRLCRHPDLALVPRGWRHTHRRPHVATTWANLSTVIRGNESSSELW